MHTGSRTFPRERGERVARDTAVAGVDLALSTVDADPNVLAAKIRDAMWR